jgi:hypothetical protein
MHLVSKCKNIACHAAVDSPAVEQTVGICGAAPSVTVVNTQNDITFTMTGSNLNVKSQLFIDNGNTAQTGYKYHWNVSSFKYLVENSTLYSYSGNGSSWSWASVRSVTVSKSNTQIVITIPLNNLNITAGSQIAFGFISNDNMNGSYPAKNETLFVYTVV